MRRILLIAAGLVLIPVGISYTTTMLRHSSTRFGVRSVEWLRDHGASPIVSWIEDTYYSINAPAKGGRTLRSLSVGGLTLRPIHRARPAYMPARIRPVIHPALRGEGVWRATFDNPRIPPPVLVTKFRSDPAYPQLVAGVAWIRAGTTRMRYIPGVVEPPVPLPRGSTAGEVPPAQRSGLLATFNGGFKLKDAAEGFAAAGHTWSPLLDGIGTLVQHSNGRWDVISWHDGPNLPPGMVFARQNLPLIINHGLLNPNLSDGPQWGFTVGNAIRVWRSGIGVDSRGNLLYAAANYQTVGSLARILLRAGAVRALELDINQDWITFITYRHPGARTPSQLLPDILKPATRYMTPDDRDFFAVFLKR